MSNISRRTAIGIFGAPLCSALAQQTSAPRERISLNGEWGALRIPEPWPRTVRENTARYERQVAIPADWGGRHITLSADCINSFAEVFVDGAKAGEMRYPAGEVDLTQWCRPGQSHTIAMQVTAMPLKEVMLSYSDSANAKTIEGTVQRRGIVGDVYLNAMPQGPRIAGVKVETSVRRWEIAVEAAVEGGEGQYRLVARVDGKEFSGSAPRFTASWHPEKLWDIHTPQNQYDLTVSLVDAAGKVLDTALPVRFGFREFWIDGRDFYLNGTRLYLSSTPLDNAGGDAKSASYEGTRATIKHFRSVGVNFMYTHNYGCEPGTHLSFEEVLRACDDDGMLVAFSQPHFGQYDWTAADAEQTNGYAKHAAFYVRVAQNHPSVIFYSTSHNGAGYSEDMNPDLIDGVHEPRDQWSARGAQRARRAESVIRKLDPSRIVYHHSGGNLNAMHTINFYGNWIPPQEMDDWFEHWATTGIKPAFTCE
jgi:beta-galactosidase